MNKTEFIKMMVQDNETQSDKGKKALYADVIDCMEIALSQSPEAVEIDSAKNLKDAFAIIQKEGQSAPGRCCGPFRAAELLAEYLGVKYVRASKKFAPEAAIKNLEDFM